MLEKNLPFVCYGRSEREKEFAWLDMDNEASMHLSIENLLHENFREIAFINASSDLYFAKMRYQGYKTAMKLAGMPLHEHRYIETELNEDDGCEAAMTLLKSDPSITAIVCANDTVAIGAIHACKQLGRTPGVDIAIVGYNNSPGGRYTEPPLTTIQHDEAHHIGHQLGEMVYQRIQGESIKNLQKLMPPQWVARGTSGGTDTSD